MSPKYYFIIKFIIYKCRLLWYNDSIYSRRFHKEVNIAYKSIKVSGTLAFMLRILTVSVNKSSFLQSLKVWTLKESKSISKKPMKRQKKLFQGMKELPTMNSVAGHWINALNIA